MGINLPYGPANAAESAEGVPSSAGILMQHSFPSKLNSFPENVLVSGNPLIKGERVKPSDSKQDVNFRSESLIFTNLRVSASFGEGDGAILGGLRRRKSNL